MGRYVLSDTACGRQGAAHGLDGSGYLTSHSVHCGAPPMEYLPGVQSSQTVSEVDVLAVLILVPAPHILVKIQPADLYAAENLPLSQLVHSAVPPTENFPVRVNAHV